MLKRLGAAAAMEILYMLFRGYSSGQAAVMHNIINSTT